jgi:hypothetical protein
LAENCLFFTWIWIPKDPNFYLGPDPEMLGFRSTKVLKKVLNRIFQEFFKNFFKEKRALISSQMSFLLTEGTVYNVGKYRQMLGQYRLLDK